MFQGQSQNIESGFGTDRAPLPPQAKGGFGERIQNSWGGPSPLPENFRNFNYEMVRF